MIDKPSKVIIELQNGQRITYVNWSADAIVADLTAMGAKAIGIKNSWHIIPRTVPLHYAPHAQ